MTSLQSRISSRISTTSLLSLQRKSIIELIMRWLSLESLSIPYWKHETPLKASGIRKNVRSLKPRFSDATIRMNLSCLVVRNGEPSYTNGPSERDHSLKVGVRTWQDAKTEHEAFGCLSMSKTLLGKERIDTYTVRRGYVSQAELWSALIRATTGLAMELRPLGSKDNRLLGTIIFVIGGPKVIHVTWTTFTASIQAYVLRKRNFCFWWLVVLSSPPFGLKVPVCSKPVGHLWLEASWTFGFLQWQIVPAIDD